MRYVEKLQYILHVDELTQGELATRMGVSRVSLGAWINGRSSPRPRHLRAIDDMYVELSEREDSMGSGSSLSLTNAQIEQVLSGGGDVDVMEVLRLGQYKKVVHRIESIIDLLPRARMAAAVALLAEAQAWDATAYQLVIMYPHIGVWSAVCLQALEREPDADTTADHVSILSAIAAVAAWQCGVPRFRVEVPVRDGGVVLPSLGKAVFDDIADVDTRSAWLECSGRQLKISVGDQIIVLADDLSRESLQWQPIRFVTLSVGGLSLSLAIDDIDVYRGQDSSLGHPHPSLRLDEFDYKTWKELLGDAWEMLVQFDSEYATSLAHTLTVVVPIRDEVRHLTAFYYDGFGAIVSTVTGSGESMAQSLLEEFQRMKAHALHSLVPLYDTTYESRYFAPWAGTPQPLGALVIGYYSMAALAEFWRDRYRSALGQAQMESAVFFSARRSWESSVADRFQDDTHLTEFGRAMVKAIHHRCSQVDEHVPAEILRLMRSCAIDRYLCFRLGNIKTSQEDIERLAQVWMSGMPCPTALNEQQYVDDAVIQVAGWKVRRQLGELFLSHPERFGDALENQHYLELIIPTAKQVDARAAAGLFFEASSEYSAMIREDLEDMEAWAGLAAVSVQSGDSTASTLGRFPELVAALAQYLGLTRGVNSEASELAKWLEPLLLRMDDFAFEGH